MKRRLHDRDLRGRRPAVGLLTRRLRLTDADLKVIRSSDLVLDCQAAQAVGLIHTVRNIPSLEAMLNATVWGKAPEKARTAYDAAFGR